MNYTQHYRNQVLLLATAIEKTAEARETAVKSNLPANINRYQKFMKEEVELAKIFKAAAQKHIVDELDEERRREIELGEQVERLILEEENEEPMVLD